MTLPSSVFAQDSTPSSTSKVGFGSFEVSTIPLPSTVSPTSPLYTDLLVSNLFHSFSCLAVGQSVIGQPCLTYQFTKNAQGMLQGVPVLAQANLSGGTLGAVTGVIGALYQNPPVRTADYLASVGQGLGIVKEANAQVTGSGEAVLNPILNLWQTSRNISYVLMIIIFLVIGLMIMFRNKLNPQTVITAQAALPGLVIGLILITFSYFLAGLISDMAFVGTNVVGYYFTAAQGKLNSPDPEWQNQPNLAQKISRESSISIFSEFVGIVTQKEAQGALANIYNKFNEEVQNWLKFLAGLIAYQFTASPIQQIPLIGQFVGPIFGLIAGGVTARDPSAILGMVLAFVAMFILIYTMLQLLLRLINCYLTIIFLTISAPFQFLLAALPGRQAIATSWILNMLGNILAFPAVLAVFYFVAYILGQSFGPLKVADLNQKQDNILISAVYAKDNSIISTNTFPLFGGIGLSFVNILLAFGALAATPAIPGIIARTIGKASQAEQLIGQEIGGGIRGGQGYAGRIPGTVGQSVQSLGTGIGGESSMQLSPRTGKLVRVTSKPGLWQAWQNKRFW